MCASIRVDGARPRRRAVLTSRAAPRRTSFSRSRLRALLAGQVPLDDDELRQLSTLGLPDQAAVISRRLSRGESITAAPAAADAVDALSDTPGSTSVGRAGLPEGDAVAGSGGDEDGDGPLAALVVDELSSQLYSITHGLLAGLPVADVVTTNYDALFERAWAAADAQFNVLPYETEPSDRYILKLHGDIRRPGDIVLTRSQMMDSREQRKALSGIVQTMLLTKHLLFVGFSLQASAPRPDHIPAAPFPCPPSHPP